MKLLLCKNVEHLGIVGDVVNVSPGYARNYLVPYGLATEPTEGNTRRLAVARKEAEREVAAQRLRLEELAGRLKDVEVTIHAKANEEGALYGSVSKREISRALEAEGYFVKPEQVVLDHPLRHLDTVSVDIRLADDLRTPVKVWVVREKEEGEGEDKPGTESAGKKAGKDEHGAHD